MDYHRDMYKSIGSNGSNSSRHQKSAAAERRQRNRQDLHAAQRCISEEPTEAPSTCPTPAATAAAPPKLTRQQQYHQKFVAWRVEKLKQKSAALAGRKQPFQVAVAKQKFIELPAKVPPMPRSQQFRPPANLPTLAALVRLRPAASQPLNNPIVTRSMARAQLKPETINTAGPKAPVFKAPTSRVAAAARKQPAPPASAAAAGRLRHQKMPQAAAANLQPATAAKPPTRNLLSVPVAAVATSGSRLPSASDGNSDGDTTAVGAPFSADGSMITSTAQKLHTRRGCTPDPQMSLDVFSPIELASGGGGGATATEEVTPLEAQAVRRSGHKRRSQRPEVAAETVVGEQIKIDLNVTPTGIIKITDAPGVAASPAAPSTPSATASDRRSLNYVSPYVSTARGKVSARKERVKRESVYRPDLNRSAESAPAEAPEVRQRREAAHYFRQQVDTEAERLSALAAHWQLYKEAHESELQFGSYADLIDVTVGQTRLLLAKKFQQFRSLIGQCETGGDGEQPVLAHDLEGFWSMVYMQVENCQCRFDKLDQLRASGWTEEQTCSAVAPRTAAAGAVRKPKVKAPRTGNPFLEQIKKASRQRLLDAKEAQRTAAAAAAAAEVGAPASGVVAAAERKTPRKSMLASVLCMEAHKTQLSGTSPAARRSLAPPTAGALAALDSNAAVTKTRSILKTPATKRAAGRAVVFAVSDATEADLSGGSKSSPLTPRRKARNALKFVCTPMQKPRDYAEEEEQEADENDATRLGAGHETRGQSFFVTPRRLERSGLGTSVVPIVRAADRFSLLDSPVVNFQRMTLADTTGPKRSKK